MYDPYILDNEPVHSTTSITVSDRLYNNYYYALYLATLY